MSDFVTRLVQRQLGEIKTAEPRLLERYAPISSSVSHLVDVSSKPSAVAATADSPPSRPEVDSAVAQRSGRPGAIAQTISKPLALPTTKATSETVQHGARPDSKAKRQSETSSTIREQAQQDDLLQAIFDERRGVSETRARTLVRTVATSRMSAPPRLVASRDAITPMQSPYEYPETEAPVHVTIGRIEVTAVTQTAPAKRASVAPGPSMSLEDYLARRQRRES